MTEERRTPPELIPYRLGELERWRTEMDAWRRTADDALRDLRYIKEDLAELADSFKGLRKTLTTFAFTIAGSAVLFAFTVLTATGKI